MLLSTGRLDPYLVIISDIRTNLDFSDIGIYLISVMKTSDKQMSKMNLSEV